MRRRMANGGDRRNNMRNDRGARRYYHRKYLYAAIYVLEMAY